MTNYLFKKPRNSPSDYNSQMKQAVKETKAAWQKKMNGVWQRRKVIYRNYWLKKLRQK
jgi:hypothetical protein